MSGDYSRITFDPRNRRSAVYPQQGRLGLDQDGIEASDIHRRSVRTLAEDVLGRVGLPTQVWPDAFRIDHIAGAPPDLSIGPGRLYVDGVQIEHFPDEDFTYLTQPFLPLPPELPAGDAIIYLRVWDREITYIEDPRLLDVALGGVDTATRLQTIWQLIVEQQDGAACGAEIPFASAGRLSTGAVAPPAPDDPCIVPPLIGYRGLENRLYKLMIFEGGPLGEARFMFSRDAGSIVAAVREMAIGAADTTLTVNRIGRDPVMRFSEGDWVTVTDDHRELMLRPPEPARVEGVDEANQTILLDRALPAHDPSMPFGADGPTLRARHTKVTRWDQTGSPFDPESPNPVDDDGLILTGPEPIQLEDGIEVRFDMDPDGGEFLTGDCWLFAARTADASVEELAEAAPRRTYHIAQVAAASDLGGANPLIADCRSRPEAEGGECCCCTLTVSPDPSASADFTSIGAAIAAIPQFEPDPERHVVLCLLAGQHLLPTQIEVPRAHVTLRGCGRTTVLFAPPSGALRLVAEDVHLEQLTMIGETSSALLMVAGADHQIRDVEIRQLGPGRAIMARDVERLLVEHCEVSGTAGSLFAGVDIEVRFNRFSGGPVQFGAGCEACRLANNDILDSVAEGVLIGDAGVVAEIDVIGNRIARAERHGIASGHFDPEDAGGDGIIDGLRICDNEIVDCISPQAQRASADPPFAAIALGWVYDLVVRDNRILGNGETIQQPCCGIYVRNSRGAAIKDNVVARNGRAQDVGTVQGVQGGVVLQNAQTAIVGRLAPGESAVGFADLAPAAAAHVVGNAISAPRGHALKIVGRGPMRIQDNRFQARDVLGEDLEELRFGGLDLFTGCVFILNFGLPSWAGSVALAHGFDLVTTEGISQFDGDEILALITAGGHTQYRGNQARLDLTRPGVEFALANLFIASLDDTVITDNQTEGIFSTFATEDDGSTFATEDDGSTSATEDDGDVITAAPATDTFAPDSLICDLLNVALTTRQSGNGLMTTPLLTLFSLFSNGFVNHCTHNQATSCIRADSTSSQSVTDGNAVIFPHEICEKLMEEDGSGGPS